MNCVELFLSQAKQNPNKTALWLANSGKKCTFSELKMLSQKAQKLCLKHGLKPGDSVLILEGLTPRLYATIIGLLGLGIRVIMVEPWMKIDRINSVIQSVKPKLFITNFIGRLWGMRVQTIREIPHWVSINSIFSESTPHDFIIEDLPADHHGMLAFTSGTTGTPKGVVRTHGYLVNSHKVLTHNLHMGEQQGSDICIFAAFALINLANGQTSLIIPPKWSVKVFQKLNNLSSDLIPSSVTCGPAFLLHLLKNCDLPSLKAIHVGGALTDCDIFDKAFQKWSEAEVLHVYGSSEAEPVAVVDAREAVRQSRKMGYFQTLCLGKPVPEISANLEPDSLWITGGHVCPEYFGGPDMAENKLYKRRDSQNRIWHCMGDRVTEKSDLWWYTGRAFQTRDDFELEQKIYSHMQSSLSFVHIGSSGEKYLCGENIKNREEEIKKTFPEIEKIFDFKIIRDPRHRARIDRKASLKKGAPWLAG